MYGPASSTTPSSSTTSGSTFSTNSQQAGNQTYVATFVPPMSSLTTTTTSSTSSSASTSSSTSTTQSQTNGSSYSSSASSQVKILSVEAMVSGETSGDSSVTFSVTYQNIGSGDIYVLEGGGSNLNVTIVSGASIIQQVSSPRCEIMVAMTPLAPGASATAVTPGCWSGFHYQLLQPGTVQVQLALGWSNGVGSGGGSTVITAEFSLS
jgi:hypothetical protein